MQAVLGVATAQGIYVLKPGAEASDYATHAQGLVDRSFACIIPHANGFLYAGSVGSMAFRSRDGNNWEPLYEGLSHGHVCSMLGHPTNPDVVYAGTSPAAVFKSTDAGKIWSKLERFNKVSSVDKWTFPRPPYMTRVRSLVHHPEMEDVIFAGIEIGGVLASLDGGATWSERGQGMSSDVNQLVVHPARPNQVYAATNSGFYRSPDLGSSWQRFNHGLPWPFVECMAVDAQDPQRWIAGVHQRVGSGAALFRSADGGETWQITYEGLPPLADRHVTSVHSHDGCFFASTDKGDIFGTDNFGDRWQRLDANLPPIRCMCSLA